MTKSFKEQLPAIVITAAIVVGGAYWMHSRTVSEMDRLQQEQLDAQRKSFEAQLKASSEETNRQIEAVNKLIKDTIQKRASDALMSEEDFNKSQAEKVDQFAEAVAKKIQPNLPIPKTPEEAERLQNEQVDKVSSRMAEKIQPILSEMSKDQNLTRDQIAMYSQRISDQIGSVLTSELAKNQQLNNNLMATRSVAQESMALSHEVTALYLSSLKDQGLFTRILTLPANVVKDVSKGSFVNSAERKKKEAELAKKMNELEAKMKELEAQQPKK